MTTTTCPLAVNESGADRHLLAKGCPACTARVFERMTLASVELWFEHGVISADARDGYRHVWAINAEHDATFDHWMAYPETEKAREFARELSALLPSGRAYC